MSGAAVTGYLEQLKQLQPAISTQIDTCIDFYTRKLWHQLTNELERLVLHPVFETPGMLVSFYENVIKDIQTRLNHLRLAQIARRVSENYTDLDQSKAFTDRILDIVAHSQEASLYLRTRNATIEMARGNFKTAKELLFEVREALDMIPDADPVVHSALTRAWMDYHRSQGTPTEYYKNALLFLAYTPKESMSDSECDAVAFELGIAACVGDDVYNFGELLSHPTIQSLENSSRAWLYHLLVAFNSGSIAAYQQITQQHAAVLEHQTAMVANKQVLEEKISITALIELVFHRPASARNISFSEIALTSNRPIEQVEHILMRAMSLGLIRGVIDEFAQAVEVAWVKPRVLKLSQIEVLRQRIVDWSNRVDDSLKYVHSASEEIIV